MKISDIQSRINLLTGVTTTEYTNEHRRIGMNRYKHRLAMLALKSQDESTFDDPNHTDYPIETANLIANQQDYSIAMSEKVLEVDKVEVTYDGTNWYKAEPYSVGETTITSDATSIANNFSSSAPYYEFKYNSIFLYPIPTQNVSSGLKVHWKRAIKEIPDLTDYTTGTVTTAASTAVVGSATVWTSAMIGRYFYDTTGQSGTGYRIVDVTDATHLTLETAFTGTAGAGHSYKITSDDIEPGFDEPFDEMIAIGVSKDWAMARKMSIYKDLTDEYDKQASLFRLHYGSKNRDRKYILKPAFENYG